MDINTIKLLLPHRYPFLLVDKVVDIAETNSVAIKNITFNEMQFLGHFPDEPVMPGVLQVFCRVIQPAQAREDTLGGETPSAAGPGA